MSKIDRFIRNLPSVFKPGINPNITALLKTWAQENDVIVEQIQNAKDQLFVRTAQDQYLTRLASSLGVTKPSELGLLDSEFQELIPNLSLKPKQIKKAFYDTLDIFWGPTFSRSNITSNNFSTFNVSVGDILNVAIDGGDTQIIRASTGDIAVGGAATSEEIASILTRIVGATLSIITDQLTGEEFVNIRTNTTGARGSVEILTSTMISPSKLDFTVGKYHITDLDQRTVLYQLRPRELIIELPATLPILRRGLKGSHHFHADATLEGPIAPNNGIWEGSFLFSTTGLPYTVTKQVCTLDVNISKGSVVQTLNVTGASDIPNEPGYLILNWGLSGEEQPVKYLSRPNSNTLILDPTHVFESNHLIGEKINVLLPDLKAYVPRVTGDDLAIYFTSYTAARIIIQDILKSLTAAGVIVKFVILLPTYDYLISNPYEG